MMKKRFLLSLVAMSLFSGAASAAQNGQINFLGAVSNTTCDIAPSVNGSANNQVDLGIAAPNGTGLAVPFSLKATNVQGCTGLTGKTAHVTWQGNLNNVGIENVGGSATDAYVSLKTVNGLSSAVQRVTSTNPSVDFNTDVLKNDGMKFTAQLAAKATEGDFVASTSYAVVYN
ncbi:fimbrial protein [Escherichia coli]|uniref:fimbrial protein n=1 Tax=Escherichia coli TaxID=562 RepID=UPI0032B50520|nr:fimbrial protein [Escherichia coli]